MTTECLERRRLMLKLAEDEAAMYALKDQQREKTDSALSILLDQARTAERDAERALHDHITEHGCLGSKISAAKG
jgi:hypothetical protein